MGDRTKTRMGMDGKGYGEKVDSILGSIDHDMSREDFLALAWACVDQASSRETVRLVQTAHAAIEDLFDAQPETLRTGSEP